MSISEHAHRAVRAAKQAAWSARAALGSLRGDARRAGARLASEEGGGSVPPGFLNRVMPFVALLGLTGGSIVHTDLPVPTEAQYASNAFAKDLLADHTFSLPEATRKPASIRRSLTAAGPLRRHEVYGFVPYWTLPGSDTYDVRGLTTIAYFGVDVGGNGSIIRHGNGWTGYRSEALVDLITRAHRAGTRVVLTAKTFQPKSLRRLATDPRSAQRLATQLIALMKAKRFDGVNLDFEGFGNDVRRQFPRFVGALAARLRRADPTWQIVLDTYVSSYDEGGFFDIDALEPAVDALFVMGYDMTASGIASPNAPLARYESAIRAYKAKVPASKIILGTPFYGYDWPTVDNRPHSRAVGPRSAITYSAIAASGWPRYWDAQAQSPWTAYKVGNQWHEVYYDDPSSLALKSRVVRAQKLRGIGAWALGMQGTDRDMLASLLGRATSIATGPSGPSALGTNGSRSAPAPAPKRTTSSSSTPKSTAKPKPKPTSSSTPKPSPSPTSTSSPLPVTVPSL